MTRDIILPPSLEENYRNYHFAPAVRAGGLIFVSGQIGFRPDFSLPEAPEEQFERVFENIRMILEEAESSLDRIVDMTSYHIDLEDHLGAFMQVKDRYIREPYPAWTGFGISALAAPGALVEVKVVAG